MYTWHTKRQNVAGRKDDHVWDNPFELHLDPFFWGPTHVWDPDDRGNIQSSSHVRLTVSKIKMESGSTNPMGIWILIVLIWWFIMFEPQHVYLILYNHRFIVLFILHVCVHIFYHILPEFSGCSAATNQWWTAWQVHPANLDCPCHGSLWTRRSRDPGPRNWGCGDGVRMVTINPQTDWTDSNYTFLWFYIFWLFLIIIWLCCDVFFG